MKNGKFFVLLFSAAIILGFPKLTFANSEYVLPYPSFMPGNFLYQPRQLISKINYYLYFGDFGKFDYFLKESDHHLVEAKTLFEYKQYFLGVNALEKSNNYFKQISIQLVKAKKNKKNTSEKEIILKKASEKHIEILTKLKEELPEHFRWTPEKSPPTEINFRQLIDTSIIIRKGL